MCIRDRGQAGGRIDQDSGHFLPAVTIDSLSLARRITMGCDAVLLLTIGAVERELLAGDLVILDCHLPWMYTNYGFISKRDRSLSAATREFMARLREVEAETVERENALLATHLDSKPSTNNPAAPENMTKSCALPEVRPRAAPLSPGCFMTSPRMVTGLSLIHI